MLKCPRCSELQSTVSVCGGITGHCSCLTEAEAKKGEIQEGNPLLPVQTQRQIPESAVGLCTSRDSDVPQGIMSTFTLGDLCMCRRKQGLCVAKVEQCPPFTSCMDPAQNAATHFV